MSGANLFYGLFDKDGDVVEGRFGYTDEGAANDALSAYERGGRNTYEDVHTGRVCGCPWGWTIHEYDDAVCVVDLPSPESTGRVRVSNPELTRFPRGIV